MMAGQRSTFIATLAILLLSFVCSTQARRIKRLDQQLSSRTKPMDLSKFQVPLSNGKQSPSLDYYRDCRQLGEPPSVVATPQSIHSLDLRPLNLEQAPNQGKNN